MKKVVSISLAILLILCIGCNRQSSKSISEMIEPIPTSVEVEEKGTVSQLSEADFRKLFENYFSFTEEELLRLNQKHQTTDEDYWNHLREYYQPIMTQKIGAYLTEKLNTKLEMQYIYDEINLPKWILLNDYIVSGEAQVNEVKINFIRYLNDEVIYAISVITTNQCYPVDEFKEQYDWSEAVGYFVKRGEGEQLENMDLYKIEWKDLEQQRYLFSNEMDEMKLEQHFWVTVDEGNSLKVKSIHNGSLWGVDTCNKQSVLDSQYITRVAFEEEPTKDETNLLINLFTILMQVSRGDYDYYEMAYETNEDIFRKMWEELGFPHQVEIREDYQVAFPVTISPYKDEMITLGVNKEHVDIQPSIYSTKRQPRFIVTIPVEALLNNNQIVYYNYKYYVGMENGKIEFIQFMNMESIDAANFATVSTEVSIKD